ncbi:hypothetical protein AMURIS_04138 [Acetatifactor muris]|uniref:Uncharacterized protein n=1 Tax=Acetatifactor muris TaxID=879566 RepID=A0A2K4ZLU8_9FIRM|nr:hypothetical protein AMURIS_04138 [Acetatifactor muris]
MYHVNLNILYIPYPFAAIFIFSNFFQVFSSFYPLPDIYFIDQLFIVAGHLFFGEKAGLPYVVFHSLRHSSTTYKLKLNHGDLKATQGDTGHAQIDMITDVYAHILDEDRKVNAQKFEATFYAKNPVNPLKDVKPPEETGTDLTNLIAALEQSPELVAMLTKALKG